MTEGDTIFRWIAALVLVSCLAISTFHRLRARRSGQAIPRRAEGAFALAARTIVGVPLFWDLLYIANPAWMSWASIALPVGLRWAGAVLGVVLIPAMVWVFRSLGRNVSETVLTKTDHTLVTHGPYRWVRHLPVHGRDHALPGSGHGVERVHPPPLGHRGRTHPADRGPEGRASWRRSSARPTGATRAARARCCLDSRRGDPSREIPIAAPARLGYNPHCVSHVRRPRAPDHPKRIRCSRSSTSPASPRASTSVPSIAESRDIPAKFLEQILLTLKRARYVRSQRGSAAATPGAHPARDHRGGGHPPLRRGARPDRVGEPLLLRADPVERERKLLRVFREIRDHVARKLESTTIADVA